LALTLVALATFVVLASGSVASADQSGVPPFRVIVNPDNPSISASRDFLERAFLKQTADWSDGESIRPVDQRPDSGVRRAFSNAVLKRSIAAVRSYWTQRIFSGRGVPPPELDSDEAVVGYVLKHRGAVGYVAGNADLKRAKELVVK
jgi:ABC-type phosphate transport system substrate-binding protein